MSTSFLSGTGSSRLRTAVLPKGRGLRPFQGKSGGQRVADPRDDCQSKWLILQAGSASSHMWDQRKPEG